MVFSLGTAGARTKARPAEMPQDQIDVLANLPVSGGPVTRFVMTKHYSRSYLYLEHSSHIVTLVDVTDASHPALLADVDMGGASGTLLTAAGDAALISSDGSAPVASAAQAAAPAAEKTMTIVSFADKSHPQTIKQFRKVTCTALDDHRGLVFVANDEGLWILHRNPAEDPELQERYAHEVVYNH